MVYRLVRFNLGTGKLEVAKNIFEDLAPQIRTQKGCKDIVCFGDEDSGNYGFAIVWESSEDSMAAKVIIGPMLSKHLAENDASAKPFSTELLEILN